MYHTDNATLNLRPQWCPYCLQAKPSTTSATLSPSDAWEDVLDAEIEHTENLISRLLLERSRLCRKRNELRSPIYSLPPEILTLIFKFACPPFDFSQAYGLSSLELVELEYPPSPDIISVLTAVSARWHNVVLSTPSLWTLFVADNDEITIMGTILSRAGNLPVAASIYFPIDSIGRNFHPVVLASMSLREQASHIHMLHIRNASTTWLVEQIPSFVNLELLCLQSDDSIEDESVLIDNSCIRLVLKNYSCRFSLSCSKIEVLHLGRMPVDVCLEMLQNCTHLIEFRLRYPCNSRFEEIPLPSSPFTLPRLKLFEWMVDYERRVDRAMLQYIRMPALRTLVWNEEDIGFKTSSSLSTFFSHLPLTLSAVHIVQGSMIHSDLSIFSHVSKLPNVEHLPFRSCEDDFMDNVFSDLGSGKCLVRNQEIPVFPKLKLIRIDGLFGDIDQAKVFKTFQWSYSRPSGSLLGSPFRLEFSKNEVDWTPDFKEALMRMIKKGHKVELWENSKPVDWQWDEAIYSS
ncbi:hypothetical protein Agabi119p4_10590 [Agaricus bisporus var. burnettii]|uniref:F-box domain-containing protein n=1 Tax=Agaricus bisporus var. burnettii TaxID=192524 RepID=A0A8H7C395_AGABI|nr:hypothetical protein Agabi119p4_10590 [Agaricus bisporus var. burnettii]